MRSERSPGRLCSANDHHPGPARSRKKHLAVSCIWSRHQVPVTFSNYERGLTPNFAWIDPVTTGTRDLKKRHESVSSANKLAYGPLETINVLDRSSGSVIAHPMATPTQLESLQKALSFDRPPLCSGAISPPPEGFNLYYGKKNARYVWFSSHPSSPIVNPGLVDL